MQREFIRYNKKVLGRPEIFGYICYFCWWVGGGEDPDRNVEEDDPRDEEYRYDDIEDEQGAFPIFDYIG